ncbi:MAG: hypothetical protein PF541_03620 [Prolixibacteraceae bacterium]|jgi:hypothetical protein|nr:hypothetical protein [Prolixibacteraceae bacterium]
MQIDYGVDKRGRIISMEYIGILSIKDIEKYWKKAIQNNLVHSEIKGFILDCRNAVIEIEEYEAKKLSDFFKKNISLFQFKRFAYLTETPNQIVFPILMQEEDYLYKSRPFSTLEAAVNWLLN